MAVARQRIRLPSGALRQAASSWLRGDLWEGPDVARFEQAFERLPNERSYRLKAPALALLKRKAKHPRHQDARELLQRIFVE